MSDEKRATVRVRKSLVAQYSQQDGDERSWRATSVIDLSESGVSIETTRVIPAGEKIFLRVRLPINLSEWLLICGKVVASAADKCCTTLTRIAFDKLDGKQLEILRDYIAWILVKERGVR